VLEAAGGELISGPGDEDGGSGIAREEWLVFSLFSLGLNQSLS